ncbi:hypothetical protein [Desulfallas sp. Bu1-1]|uniref:hypothetical protein n=1 Tax=Desulfallas sp. Bu1-1 TaxID=2787620 RepID=UPI001FACE1B3|nr:hypothetical protein [Desulfallas sp. Bu1-1]
MAKRLNKFLKADIERGFILAYYELVKGCSVSLDKPGENFMPVVAFAHKPGEIYGMDFSSTYHFAEKEKPQTRLRRVRRKIDELQRFVKFMESQWEMEHRLVYEIWCFLRPNRFVTETVDAARKEGLPVELVDLDQVHERIRQVAMLEPMNQDVIYENAFLWAARLFREAGAWK